MKYLCLISQRVLHSWGNPKQSLLDIYRYALQILYLNLNPIKYSKNKTNALLSDEIASDIFSNY